MSDDNAIKDCELLIQRCFDDPTYESRCVSGEYVFYYAYDKALLPGHIYSEIGMDEYKISKCCEYHFDEWFKEPEYDGDVSQDSDSF